MNAATSGSSLIRILGIISRMVTREPSRAKTCANSTPMGPPPRIAIESGSSFSSKTVS